MEEIAFGWMGLSSTEFYTSTERQFFNRLNGWKEDQERVERSNWERTRMHIFRMVSMLPTKANKPKDVLRLPWDSANKKEAPKDELTEDQKRLLDKWESVDPDKPKKPASISDVLKFT